MMNHELIIFGVAGLVAILLFVVIPFFMTKFGKGNIDNYITNSKFVLGFIQNVVSKFKLPNKKEKVIVETLHYAQIAVNYVEGLYKAGQLEGADRKVKAVEFVLKALDEQGFPLTNKDKFFIEQTIEVIVFMLPKTNK